MKVLRVRLAAAAAAAGAATLLVGRLAVLGM